MGLFTCDTCKKTYTNPISHVCKMKGKSAVKRLEQKQQRKQEKKK